MTENKRLIQYKVLCDEYEEVARILFEIIESGEQIEGHHQIQEWVNNLYKENNELLRENKQLKSKLEESKKAHSNCDKLWWELHDEKEQLEKEHEKLTSVNQELRNELKFDEKMYKTFKEIIDEADDLITSHLSKHYQRQWKNFCKHRGVLDD